MLRFWTRAAFLQLLVLRTAALLVPRSLRQQWLEEWNTELWYVRQHAPYRATTFCLGALADGIWVRRNVPPVPGSLPHLLVSPMRCLLALAAIAISVWALALRLPGSREHLVRSPYRNARDLVTISSPNQFTDPVRTVTVGQYELLKRTTTNRFSSLAWYRPMRAMVKSTSDRMTEWRVAQTSRTLLELLGVTPVSSRNPALPTLLLHEAAWSRYFSRDPGIVGRIVEIDGRKALVAGLLAEEHWRLPGEFDAWLIEEERLITAQSPESAAFVLGRVKPTSVKGRPSKQWRMFVADEKTGDKLWFECRSLDKRPPMYVHLMIAALALLILPVSVPAGSGRYPSTSCTPRTTLVLRWWLFLVAKLSLVCMISFFGVLVLACILNAPIQPHGWLVGHILVLRWGLVDQRKRCPVCLRTLTFPMRVGSLAQIFLAWHGTELTCAKGHGLLHVPEISTSYSADRWLHLDSSWAALFKPMSEPIRQI